MRRIKPRSVSQVGDPSGGRELTTISWLWLRDLNREAAMVIGYEVVIDAETEAPIGCHDDVRVGSDHKRLTVVDPPDKRASGHAGKRRLARQPAALCSRRGSDVCRVV